MEELDGADVLACVDAAAWDAWLAAHHERHEGVWVRVAKAGTGIASVTSDELVDVGLCWGWISGHRRRLDDRDYLQKYVPRRPRSRWSQVNVAKVEALLAKGRMRGPGMAEVAAAKADGRWEAAYPSQRTATVPPEVQAVLDRSPEEQQRFDALDRSAQYLLYLPVLQATTAKARCAKAEQLIAALTR